MDRRSFLKTVPGLAAVSALPAGSGLPVEEGRAKP